MKIKRWLFLTIPFAFLLIGLVLAFAKPMIRVTQETDETGKTIWNVVAVGLSFRQFFISPDIDSVEIYENGEWKPCPFNPGMENTKSGMYLISLNQPGEKKSIFKKLDFVFNLSAAGHYRVGLTVYTDIDEEKSFRVVCEFRVR